MKILGNYCLLFTLLFFCSEQVAAQNFLTTPNGLKYKYFVNSDSGTVAGEGGYIELHIVAKTRIEGEKKDTVLTNSYTDVYGANKMLVPKPTHKGCINEGFAMLKAGDSVVFKVIADSLYSKTFKAAVPSFLTGKEEVEIITKVLFSQTQKKFEQKQEEVKQKEEAAKLAQLEKEHKLLREEAKRLGYGDKLLEDESGVLYVKVKETDSLVANVGDIGSFFYKGSFIGGNVFDGNFGKSPFDVTIGKGGVIVGWLAVVGEIKLGEKWIIFIPSSLAYGENGSGRIPPNTPLIFEMELAAISSAEEVARKKEALNKQLRIKETEQIKAYIKGKGFKKETDIDIYTRVDKIGEGDFVAYGDRTVVKLKGFDLFGNAIMQFTMENPPINEVFRELSFPKSMELVLLQLKKGGKASVVSIAKYFQGEEGGGIVAPFTPIFFELEVIDVVKNN